MSVMQGNLCSLLIFEHFGQTARKIHEQLQWGPKTIKLLVSATGLPIAVVKRVMCIFIQYGFVLFVGNKGSIAEYNLQPQRILLLLRYPKYLSLINEKYGEPSKLIVEEILKNGRLTATKAILQVWKKLKNESTAKFNNKVAGLQDSFNELILKQYITQCPMPENEIDRVPRLILKETSQFQPLDLNLQKLIKLEKGEIPQDQDDDKIFWRINFDRFHQDIRDEIMINAIKERFDKHAGKLMEVLLRLIYIRTDAWATQSNPVPVLELRDTLEKENTDPYLIQFLEQYLKIMDDSCNFIKRTAEGTSASVYVNFVTALTSLASSTIASIVEQRFGPKSARIFRIVRNKVYTDQDQLQKIAMIPDKEAKQLTYRLLQESFLHMHELKKSVSIGPVKNFYLFHVNFNQVCQVVLDMCFKTFCNTLTRATHEKNENIRLIDKFEKLNLLAASLRDQGNDDAYIQQVMDEFSSPPEKTLLESVERMIQKLRIAELNMDETIFILQLYNYYDSCKLMEKK